MPNKHLKNSGNLPNRSLPQTTKIRKKNKHCSVFWQQKIQKKDFSKVELEQFRWKILQPRFQWGTTKFWCYMIWKKCNSFERIPNILWRRNSGPELRENWKTCSCILIQDCYPKRSMTINPSHRFIGIKKTRHNDRVEKLTSLEKGSNSILSWAFLLAKIILCGCHIFENLGISNWTFTFQSTWARMIGFPKIWVV